MSRFRQPRRLGGVIGENARGAGYFAQAIAAKNGDASATQERFARVPISLVNDLRVSAEAVRVYAVLRDVEHDGACKISLRRIGERIGRQERAVEAIMRNLKTAGWVEVAEDQNGRCRVYRLKTPAADNGGLESGTPAVHDGGQDRTPAVGDIKPLPSTTKTPAVDCQPPRCSLDVSLERDQSKKEDDEEDALPSMPSESDYQRLFAKWAS